MPFFRPAVLLLFASLAIIGSGIAQQPGKAGLTIVKHGSSVSIRGDASSVAHDAMLRSTASALFGTSEVELAQSRSVPAGWVLLTEMTLRAVATTLSASAVIGTESVVIQGLTAEPEEFERRLAQVKRSLLPEMALDNKVATVLRTDLLPLYCQQLFAAALKGRRVEFASSDEQPAVNSYPLLDELVEIATDCPTASVKVIGHSDATGDNASNIRLSEVRAQAVVDHMVQRGLSAERLTAVGLGSSHPLASNDNARGRRRNRRIEFELSFD